MAPRDNHRPIDELRYRRLCELAVRWQEGGREALSGEPIAEVLEVERILAGDASSPQSPVVDRELITSLAARITGDLGLAAADRRVPPVVAGYRFERHLGSGAHAEVWEAVETTPLARRVALKVVTGLASQLRFDLERQIHARLSHPNIARVFGAGATVDGRPYLAMELLSGRTFVDACLHPPIPIRERVRLFVGACRGVQLAHERGILHRDLKPSNILVVEENGQPLAKVIDFGVAKAMAGQEAMTQAGQLVGTPAYMSPEQLGLDPSSERAIDVRSDVYGLGAVLFEALVGAPRWDLSGRSVAQAIRLVDTTEPRPVENGDRSIDIDLRAIIERSLEREPQRRFPSVAALVEDLERWLDGAPVLSRPASPVRRAMWLARRHRVRAAVVVGATIALAGLVVGGAVLYVSKERENRRLRDWSAATVQALVALADVPGSDDARDRLSALVVEELRGIVRDDDPTMLGLWADALCRRSDILRERGTMAEAAELREQALSAAMRVVELRPDSATDRRRLARTMVLVGDVARETSRPRIAEARYRDAHAIFIDLAARDAGDAAFEIPLLWSYDRLIDVAMSEGRIDESRVLVDAMHDLSRRLDPSRNEIDVLQARIAARSRAIYVGTLHGERIDTRAARDANLRDCAALNRLAPENRTYEIMYALECRNGAVEQLAAGDRTRSDELFGESLATLRRLVSREPGYLDGWARLAESAIEFARTRARAGDFAAAAAAADEALAASERALSAQPENPAYLAARDAARAVRDGARSRLGEATGN